MMDRTFSGANVRASCVPASSFQLFLMPCGPPNPQGSSVSTDVTLMTPPGDMLRATSLDIVSLNIILLDIWHSALMDMFEDSSSAPVAFWRRDSTHAAIEERLMEFEMSECNQKSSPTSLIQNRCSPKPLYRG